MKKDIIDIFNGDKKVEKPIGFSITKHNKCFLKSKIIYDYLCKNKELDEVFKIDTIQEWIEHTPKEELLFILQINFDILKS
jgi:hypothetical protein